MLKALYAHMDVFVATRFHSALFEMASGVPTIAIECWGPKARGFMKQLGEEGLLFLYAELSAERLAKAFDDLWARRVSIRRRLTQTMPQFASVAHDAVRNALVQGRAAHGSGMTGGPRDRLRILLVGLNSSYGGVERHLVDLSRELAARGHDVILVAPTQSVLAELARANTGVHVAELARSPLSILALSRLWRRVLPDIVHLHGPLASVLGRTTARTLPPVLRHRTAVISTAHGWISVRLRGRRLYEWVWNHTAPWEDAIVAVAPAVRSILAEHGYPGPIYVIRNGIDASWGKGVVSDRAPNERPFRIGYFGRLDREKGFHVLFEALSRIATKDWRLSVYGDGRDRDILISRVRAEGLTGRIEFLGVVPHAEIPARMADCHVVAVPSLQEGHPYVVLEALHVGVPVVASSVGGVPDVVRDGENGLLVPPGDPGALAATLSRMLDHPDLVARLQEGARGSGLDSTSAEMTDRLVEVYRETLAARRSKAARPAVK